MPSAQIESPTATQLAYRRAWWAALKSGEYRQTREGNLNYFTPLYQYYCVLGVACELAPYFKVHLTPKYRMHDDHPNEPDFGCVAYDGKHFGKAPQEVVEALGLVDVWGANSDSSKPSLSDLNDNYGMSFDLLADELATGNYFVDGTPLDVEDL